MSPIDMEGFAMWIITNVNGVQQTSRTVEMLSDGDNALHSHGDEARLYFSIVWVDTNSNS